MPTELNSLFGTESLTFEQFEAKVKAAGMKLTDLSGGQYVDKQKYESMKTERDTAISERDSLKAEKQTAEDTKTVKEAGVSDDFAEFVLSKTRKDVTDKVTLKDAVAAYLAEHPQYKSKPTRRVSSQSRQEGGSPDEPTINNRMNNILRGEK